LPPSRKPPSSVTADADNPDGIEVLFGVQGKDVKRNRDNKINPRALAILAVLCFLPMGWGWLSNTTGKASQAQLNMTSTAFFGKAQQTPTLIAPAQIVRYPETWTPTWTPRPSETSLPTTTPSVTATPSSTPTVTPSIIPSYTPSVTPTFTGSLWLSISSVWPDRDQSWCKVKIVDSRCADEVIPETGIEWRTTENFGVICPPELPNGAEIFTERGERLTCIGHHKKGCTGSVCKLFLYSRTLRNEMIKGKESDQKPLQKPTDSAERLSIYQKR